MSDERDDGSSTMMNRYLQGMEITDMFVSMNGGGQGSDQEEEDVDMRNGGEAGEVNTSQPTFDSAEAGDGDDHHQAADGGHGDTGLEQEDTSDNYSTGVHESESSRTMEQESQGGSDGDGDDEEKDDHEK